MNKKRLFTSAMLLGGVIGTLPIIAQTQSVTLRTSKAIGEDITIIVNKQATNVDWGDGQIKSYTTDTIKGKKAGETITIYGNEYWSMLDCSNNSIVAINTNKAPNLMSFYCSNNEIEALNLYKNTKLVDLDASNNKITSSNSLILTECVKLQSLNISSNGFKSSFSTSYFPELQYLDVSDNALSSLSLTKSSKLDMLICNNNKLTKLDLSKNTSLSSFVGSNNNFTSVVTPSTGLPDLIDFVATSNSLETLDLSASSTISNITCSDNKLRKISLPTRHTLYSYIVKNNYLSFTSLSTNNKPTNLEFVSQNDFPLNDYLPNNSKLGRYMFISNYSGEGTKELNMEDQRKDADNAVYIKNWNVYSVKDGVSTQLVKGTDYNENSGKVSFIKPFDKVYITMDNSRTGIYNFGIKTEAFAVLAEPTGINQITTNSSNDITITTDNGTIKITAPNTTNVKVLTTGGKIIWNGSIDSVGKTISLEKGIYIINNKKVSI